MIIARKNLFWIAIGAIGLVSLYLIVVLGVWLAYQDRAYPGTLVAGISVSGRNKEEIKKTLDEAVSAYENKNLAIISAKPTEKTPKDLGLSFDTEKAAQEIIAIGEKNPFILGKQFHLPLSVSVKSDDAFNLIDEQATALTTAAESSELKLVSEKLVVSPGDPGKRVNYSDSLHNLLVAAGNLEEEFHIAEFTVSKGGVTSLSSDLEAEIVKKTKSGIILKTPDKNYMQNQQQLLSWVGLSEKDSSSAMLYEGDELFFPGRANNSSIFSEQKIAYTLSSIATEINRSPQNAKLGSSAGKVTVTSPDKNGQRLNIDKGAIIIADALDKEMDEAVLPVDQTKAEIRADNLSELGLLELISTGYSNFAGSPTNRRHNIRVGAAKFNGYLIRPDETFSFITVLGPVDASTGYLPELVIKENKTVPEYGGGMCQVSSTAFRAALNAGLPIIERTAHAYPVSYYKPYGVDATVYIPKPDLVFKNDTGKYIFIQTVISGNVLSFDFYGTKPTRTVKFAGNENGNNAVSIVEKVTPLIYDAEARGKGSFTAVVWRLIYDSAGKLIGTSKFTSKYDSPDKYPH